MPSWKRFGTSMHVHVHELYKLDWNKSKRERQTDRLTDRGGSTARSTWISLIYSYGDFIYRHTCMTFLYYVILTVKAYGPRLNFEIIA